MTFIIIILLLFVLWPLAKAMYRLWLVRKQMQQAYRRMQQAARQGSRTSSARPDERPGGWSPASKRKVVRPDQGEYIEWEETTYTQTDTATNAETASSQTDTAEAQTQTHTTSSTTSQRITDVEWEDIVD